MSIIFKFLCFSVCLAAGTSSAGCSSGDGDDDGAGGTGGVPGGNAGGGAGGAPSAATKLFTFDMDTADFKLNTSVSTDPMYVNLGAPGDVDVPEPPPSIDWASKDFDGAAPSPGSLKITALFSGWNQSVSVEAAAPVDDVLGAPRDFTDKALKARVFLESGLSNEADAPGGAIFFIKTGADYAWGQAPWKNLDVKNQWVEVRFDTKHPDPGSKPEFDPANPVQMGFQFSSGGGNMHPPEDYPDQLETVIYLDQITVEPCTPILCPG